MYANRQMIVLDTDIGTDVDDVVALALLLRLPDVDLRAVTTVYVDAALRARMVQAVLDVAGRPDIAVGRGVDTPLLNRDALAWAGFEGEGLLPANGDQEQAQALPHAVDLLVATVLARPGEVTILAIGPLTNVALALLREPRLAMAVRRIVIMGGMVQRRFDQLTGPFLGYVSDVIISQITPRDITPPSTTASLSPTANWAGWNNTAVTVALAATDAAAGSGVQSITYMASGAQTIASTTVPGASTSFTISTDGQTTITYHATDNAGNVEAAKTLTVNVDTTRPLINGQRSPAANAAGWNDSPVTVIFSCTDAVSLIAAYQDPGGTPA